MFENLSEEQQTLVKSLQKLGFEDDAIQKGLNISQEEVVEQNEPAIEKSIDEQIADKKSELESLEARAAEKVEKSEGSQQLSTVIDSKLDEITKSLNSNVDSRFEGLTDLVKSLTDVIVKQQEEFTAIKEDNEKLVKGNDDFKKSFSETADIINKIAEYSPGLKSLRTPSATGFTQRFEKSENGNSGMELMSITSQKDAISSKLSNLVESNEEIRKSISNDIASFEVSNKVSPKLEKVFADELKIEVVQ